MNMDMGMTHASLNGYQLLQAFQAAEQWLKQHVPSVNALNVFPVPDGDTGTNMHMTLAAALREVTPGESCAAVSEQIYHGALMAARGNSGVILSQILRGIAQGLAGHVVCGPAELVDALRQASQAAYQGASEPCEGTILTVIRETADAAQVALADTEADLLAILTAAVAEAYASVERTPTMLQVLRDAGVVDAGGRGLYILLEGMLRWAKGESVSLAQVAATDQDFTVAFTDVHGSDDFGFCTNVLLSGTDLPFKEIREHINAAGTSVVVVGDESLVRIHVHTTRPGDILNYATQYGELLQIEITNMDRQRAALHHVDPAPAAEQVSAAAQGAPPPIGVVAVVPGQGFADIFRSLQAGAIVMGGQTMNPSTQDLVEAIGALPQPEVIVLPNNSNIILAAQQAAAISSKQVQIVPSKTLPQGIAALMGFGFQRGLTDNVAAMQREMERVVTAEITTAVRDAVLEGQIIRANQTLGLIDGAMVAVGDDRQRVVDDLLHHMELVAFEIVTIYYGQVVPVAHAEALAERVRTRYANLEVEVRSGGQPLYDYIIAAE